MPLHFARDDMPSACGVTPRLRPLDRLGVTENLLRIDRTQLFPLVVPVSPSSRACRGTFLTAIQSCLLHVDTHPGPRQARDDAISTSEVESTPPDREELPH